MSVDLPSHGQLNYGSRESHRHSPSWVGEGLESTGAAGPRRLPEEARLLTMKSIRTLAVAAARNDDAAVREIMKTAHADT